MRASGEMYCVSDEPFTVNGQWIQAGAAEVWIGGRPYHTQANGASSPYCLPPGQQAQVRLLTRGNARVFSILEVEVG